MVVMFACFLGAAAVFLMAWLVTTGYGYLPWWGGVFILLLAALVVVGFAAGVSDLSVNPEQIERATLSRGLCPSCWELIQGLPAAEDGCSMCPECGSAWRLPTDQPDPADGS